MLELARLRAERKAIIMNGPWDARKVIAAVAIPIAIAFSAFAFQASSIPHAQLIEPEDLVKVLNSKGPKPLLIHVGFHVLYLQAHIPNSEYVGPARDPAALEKLRARVKPLPRNKLIVIYCGCCPWDHCPNVKPAHDALVAMGFTNIKVLHVPDNIATDWIYKGFPTAKGE
jgi:thiosulfate/3-mercaptopyruvate sulfurtransferase